jgi:hypothetical protein
MLHAGAALLPGSVGVPCHGSIENQPVIIESKPATFVMVIGKDNIWQEKVVRLGFCGGKIPQICSVAQRAPAQGQNGIMVGGRVPLCRIWP